MRKVLTLALLVAIGGSFNACTATRAWVTDTLKEELTVVKAEAGNLANAAIAGLLDAGKAQGQQLLDRIKAEAKKQAAAAIALLDAKRLEAQKAQWAKIDAELAKLVPDLAYDTNKDNAVTAADFLDAGELTPAGLMRLMAYQQRQPAKDGQKKDNTNLLVAGGVLVALYAAKKGSDALKGRLAPPGAPTPPPGPLVKG